MLKDSCTTEIAERMKGGSEVKESCNTLFEKHGQFIARYGLNKNTEKTNVHLFNREEVYTSIYHKNCQACFSTLMTLTKTAGKYFCMMY